VQLSQDLSSIEQVKLVGYAKSFVRDRAMPFEHDMPEYQPPEILSYIRKCKKVKDQPEEVIKFSQETQAQMKPWSQDFFSLGMTIVEIFNSCPIWQVES
jgi:hypothetical protein